MKLTIQLETTHVKAALGCLRAVRNLLMLGVMEGYYVGSFTGERWSFEVIEDD